MLQVQCTCITTWKEVVRIEAVELMLSAQLIHQIPQMQGV
jgi:hypothetical protein